MELTLNLLWLLLAALSFALAWRDRGNHTLAGGHSWRRTLSLACALVIFFPVISLTDDLHAAQVVMEDSNPLKRISEFSGAHHGVSNLERSSLSLMAAPGGFFPSQVLRVLGFTAIRESCLLIKVRVERSSPRAPPSPLYV